jgi:outer membrane receptor for ferrienterochelin and colicins
MKKTIIMAALFLGMVDRITASTVLGDSAVNLNEVVVTATRTPKLLKNVPYVTKVITAQDIQKVDVNTIEDLLKTLLPGVEFTYSMNQQTSLNMQGFGGNAVLFLVDGERLAGETLDNVDYDRLTLNNVERIEIVKGAASSLYGSNAVGGVVNIITKKQTRKLSANVYSRWSAYNSRRYGGSLGFKTGAFTSLSDVQYNTVGDINMPNAGDFSKVYANHAWNLNEKLTWKPVSKLLLTGKLGYFFRERIASKDSHERYRDLNASLKGDYNISKTDKLQMAYSFDEYDKSDYATYTKKDVRDYCNTQNILRTIYSHQFCDIGTLTLGGDFMRDYLNSYQFAGNGSERQYTADMFAQYDWNITDQWNMIGGLRYDYFSKSDNQNLSAKLGLMYKLQKWRFRASYAGGFRAPSLKEMFMNFNMANVFMIYGNENLKAERSQNFQLSAEYAYRNYSFTASGFYNHFNHRITTSWNQTLQGMQYINMSRLQIYGIDMNIMARYACGISASASYVYTSEHIRSGEPLTTSTRPHTAVLLLSYDHDWKKWGMKITLTGRYLSSLTTDEYTSVTSYTEIERVKYPGYQIWKLTAIGNLHRGVKVTFSLDNLFNYVPGYYYSNSPATCGTVFSTGVSFDIDKLLKI